MALSQRVASGSLQTLWSFVLLVAALSGGCVPHIAHTPKVEAGTRFFISSAVTHVNDVQDESASLVPSLYLGGRRGWVTHDSTEAFSLGLQVPVFLMPLAFSNASLATLGATSYFDIYIEPHRITLADVNYGFGTLLSTGVTVPYIQFGRARNGGMYTTQALALTYGEFESATYWLGTVAVRAERPDLSRAVDYYANAAFSFDSREREWFVGFGVVVEFGRKRRE